MNIGGWSHRELKSKAPLLAKNARNGAPHRPPLHNGLAAAAGAAAAHAAVAAAVSGHDAAAEAAAGGVAQVDYAREGVGGVDGTRSQFPVLSSE
jgi:hypothetical protein